MSGVVIVRGVPCTGLLLSSTIYGHDPPTARVNTRSLTAATVVASVHVTAPRSTRQTESTPVGVHSDDWHDSIVQLLE